VNPGVSVEAGSGRAEGTTAPSCRRAAIVLFADSTQLRWLRVLRAGFRHCLVAVCLGRAWVIVDPLSHKTALSLVEGYSAEDLVGWYESQGFRAIVTTVREVPAKLAPLGPSTCVEAVKRILGIHARSVMTPRQLYDYLVAARDIDLDIG
jgi:hypothetical protein